MGLVQKTIYVWEPAEYAQMAIDDALAELDYRYSDDPEAELERWLGNVADVADEEMYRQQQAKPKRRRKRK